jgi:hypothetical protein
MARNLEAELREEDGTWPACWRPQEGETLVATVRKYSTGMGTYGECRTVILERPDGSRVSLWLSSVVLLSLFEREKPRIGERIGLKFLGKHPVKGYKRFSLLVDRPEQALDFSPLGGEKQDRDDDDDDPFAPIPAAGAGSRR